MKEQIIEEAATALLWKKYPYHPPKDYGYWKDMFKEGAKWNEEIMIDFANWCRIHDKKFPNEVWTIQQLHTKYFAETYGNKGNDVTSSQTEKMYSEEDLREALFSALNIDRTTCCTTRTTDSIVRESIQLLETYGSKGSETTSSQTTSEKWKEYQDWLNEVPEISDEEIEKVANDYLVYNDYKRMWIIKGMKLYREQLKKK